MEWFSWISEQSEVVFILSSVVFSFLVLLLMFSFIFFFISRRVKTDEEKKPESFSRLHVNACCHMNGCKMKYIIFCRKLPMYVMKFSSSMCEERFCYRKEMLVSFLLFCGKLEILVVQCEEIWWLVGRFLSKRVRRGLLK